MFLRRLGMRRLRMIYAAAVSVVLLLLGCLRVLRSLCFIFYFMPLVHFDDLFYFAEAALVRPFVHLLRFVNSVPHRSCARV